ncbi:MAG: thiamine-phosphate kinase [Candidatus Accumulibacter sp.]|jgi:thiamine-monophosphate kinase|nr:thiamine-phosphate kinase [Accumulibacter sp.]
MTSEFDLIARHFVRPAPQTILGPGDDGALFVPSPGMTLAVTADMLVSGTHFFPDADPEKLGWKALAVSLSDLAAMGARPRWALLALSLPAADENWLARFSAGLFACARRYGVDLAGGDTTRGPLNLCVTAFGELPAGTAMRRDAAQAGDDLWISGLPGLAALGLAHLRGEAALPGKILGMCLDRLEKPLPRVELGLALREEALARAVIDISDGLLADAGHLAESSSLDADIDAFRLPGPFPAMPSALFETFRKASLSGGDDYELAFSAAPGQREAIAALGRRLDLPLWRIGRFSRGRGKTRLLDEQGGTLPVIYKGFDHFAETSR